MRPKIIVFDKFLGYGVGGAQHSFHLLLENLSGEIEFFGCNVEKWFLAKKYEIKNFSIKRINIKEIPQLPYLEYFLNRKRIIQFFLNIKGDILFAQSLWAPLAINSFQGKTVYFIRDEYQLNQIPNYYVGIKKFLKKIYLFSQYPFLKIFFSDNEKAIKKADLVIANSNFIKKAIKEKFNKDSEVIYPLIDIKKFQKIKLPSLRERPFLTLIGSEFIKGRKIVEKIAEKMRDHQFMIVGRLIKKPIKKGNILYHPWLKNPLDIYRKTKILLVTSLCQDSFPRVTVEGAVLGIPSLGSKKGGISEFLPEALLVEDVLNIEKWIAKIKELENDYYKYSQTLKEKAILFDAQLQINNFKKILKNKLNLEV